MQRFVQQAWLSTPVMCGVKTFTSTRESSWDSPDNLSMTSWDMPVDLDEDIPPVFDEALDKIFAEIVQDTESGDNLKQAVARMGVSELADMQYVKRADLYNQKIPVVLVRRFLEACKPVSETGPKKVNIRGLEQSLSTLPFKKVGPITESEVNAAQERWAQSLVEIGRLYLDGGDYKARAAVTLDDLYAYGQHSVLFKPTKAANSQFRSGRKDALSYFVGGDEDHPEDAGFAITPWTAVRFGHNNLTTLDDITLAMGNYYFTDTTGKETKVEYTFGYWRDGKDAIRIVLHHSSLPYKNIGPITESEVHAVQERWAQSIVDIGRVYTAGGDYKARAAAALDELYAYGRHSVLFKPTKVADSQFRSGREDALSYFIGGDESHAEDTGFAITPWTAVRFEPSGLSTLEDSTVAMGNYYFTDTTGKETKVEYTFGYWRDEEEAVRIVLHHSSLPYQP